MLYCVVSLCVPPVLKRDLRQEKLRSSSVVALDNVGIRTMNEHTHTHTQMRTNHHLDFVLSVIMHVGVVIQLRLFLALSKINTILHVIAIAAMVAAKLRRSVVLFVAIRYRAKKMDVQLSVYTQTIHSFIHQL